LSVGQQRQSDDLFSEIGPYDAGYLPVGSGHSLYWEQAGCPQGQAVLFLHGGPGAGAGTVHRRFFDPAHWRIVIFDQRGAGRSRPRGSILDNSTPLLIEDIEALRCRLGIEKWLLFGGSWGATLSLCYAQAHPDRVSGLVLFGVFLGRPEELDWFFRGLANIFPDAHAVFLDHLPESERHDPAGAYLSRLLTPDPNIHVAAARAWLAYETTCSTLLPAVENVTAFSRDAASVGQARIEAHYFANGLFLPPAGILSGLHRITHLRAEIIQARYDMICPARSAYQLAENWPAARLAIIPGSGHQALEPGVRKALVSAVASFRSHRD